MRIQLQSLLRRRVSLFLIENDQELTMRRAREKVVATVPGDVVALLEQGNVAGLGDGVAAEIEDARR